MLTWDKRLMIGKKSLDHLRLIVHNPSSPESVEKLAEKEFSTAAKAGETDQKINLPFNQEIFPPKPISTQQMKWSFTCQLNILGNIVNWWVKSPIAGNQPP